MKIASRGEHFEWISDDSRECGPGVAFVLTQNSKPYQNRAIEQGSEVFLTPQDLHRYLQTDLRVVGVTGTNGKTTTSAAIYSALLDLGYRAALLGTRGFFINDSQVSPKGLTTPMLLEVYHCIHRAKQSECDFFIMEVSSHAIAQKRIEGLHFALKILTNITSDHLDYHRTLQEYIDTKNLFFADDSPKLINLEESHARFNPQGALSYALERPATYCVKAYSLAGGIEAQVAHLQEMVPLSSPLFGRHNLYNLLAAFGALHQLTQRPLNEISRAIEHFGGVEGRMERVSEDPLIIVDFAHTEDGMRQIFESFPLRDLVVVFGAGGDRDKSKRPRMGAVAARYAKRIYLTSDNPRSENPSQILCEIASGIPATSCLIQEVDRIQAIRRAVSELKADEILLVLGKGDEAEQIIGDQKIPMKDRDTILQALALL